MRVALVGVTGLVGQVMLEVLSERRFPVNELLPVASKNSLGKSLVFKGHTYTIGAIEDALATKPDLALFSAGSAVSTQWAPQFAANGCVVIDNSSAWRMDASKKLIVPEINGHTLTKQDTVIANPNCSTIQLVMVLAPLHKHWGLKRVVVSTYQSVSGTGAKAIQQLDAEIAGINGPKAYAHPIHKNALPHCDAFHPNGYTLEELKVVKESQKILDSSFGITATAVRIPADGGHSESVNIALEKPFKISEVSHLLAQTEGVCLQDDPENLLYPMPLYAKGKDAVFVGRIREDFSQANTLNLWIVSDNLRKGAATNAIQIAESLLEKGLL